MEAFKMQRRKTNRGTVCQVHGLMPACTQSITQFKAISSFWPNSRGEECKDYTANTLTHICMCPSPCALHNGKVIFYNWTRPFQIAVVTIVWNRQWSEELVPSGHQREMEREGERKRQACVNMIGVLQEAETQIQWAYVSKPIGQGCLSKRALSKLNHHHLA